MSGLACVILFPLNIILVAWLLFVLQCFYFGWISTSPADVGIVQVTSFKHLRFSKNIALCNMPILLDTNFSIVFSKLDFASNKTTKHLMENALFTDVLLISNFGSFNG